MIKTKVVSVEYDNPEKRNRGENKSKLLKPDTELFNHLMKMKEYLLSNGFHHEDRMALHSEVLNHNSETYDTFIRRVNMLEGRKIDIYDTKNYCVVGRAVVLLLGRVEGYLLPAKITIAFFDNGKEKLALEALQTHIKTLSLIE